MYIPKRLWEVSYGNRMDTYTTRNEARARMTELRNSGITSQLYTRTVTISARKPTS